MRQDNCCAAFRAGLMLLAVALWQGAAQAGGGFGPDPVEALREALVFRLGDERRHDFIGHRIAVVTKRIAALKSPGEMRRALTLQEWKDAPGMYPPLKLADQTARIDIAKRLTKLLESEARSGNLTRRLAAAHFIGAMGTDIRAPNSADHSGFARTFTPLLATLCEDKEGVVRAAAAAALGRMNADPIKAAAALGKVLRKDDLPQRRAAAEALSGIVHVVAHLRKRGTTQSGLAAFDEDVLDAGREVIPVAALGLKDSDAQVRRLCVEAFRETATAFRELIPEPYATSNFPPPGRPLTPQERAQMGQIIKRLEQDLTLYQPLLSGLKGQAAGLAEALKDAEPRVIEVAANTLEALGEARRRLRGLLDSVPVAGKEGVPDKGDEDPLGPILRKGVPALAAQVGHPNVRSRLACLYALEAAGADAAPAAQAVIKALKDENAFVRWAAVRALGRMAPLKGAQADAANAVTGLARCLKDDNADVRGTAFVALSRYGPAAKPAVAALAEIVKASSGDTVPAIRTLEAIGPEAKVAIPALMAALEAKSPQVRAAAARLLGKLGPDAVQAAAALTRVLGDPNVEVRQAAAEALLAVTPAEK